MSHSAVQPQALGLPLRPDVADAAAEWLTVLMSDEASDGDRQRCRQWRAAHPDHERAWQHIEAVTGRLKLLEPRAAQAALGPRNSRAPSPGRRRALNVFAWCTVGGGAALFASRTQIWQQTLADHRTGVGERRSVDLPDGTRVTLNTDSAISVRFDGERRLLQLVAGEIMVSTGHGEAAGPRPFIVLSAQGRIRALGTRFSVRQHAARTEVAVLESAVEITPLDASGQAQRVQAGERAMFSATAVEPMAALSEADAAWTRGQIVADNMRLQDFLAELGRYRHGLLRCDPAVAGLRLSGVFPLDDTERILQTLPSVLPVQVRTRTRWWVTVEASG